MSRCAACPVAASGPCRSDRFPFFCEWAASGDTTKRLHIINRSSVDRESTKIDPPAPFPPLVVQARNLAGAVGRFVAGGMGRRTPEQQAAIMAVCRGCEFFRGHRCLKCGCWANLKARLASEHCPIGKW
jgi:hypothetical protein